MGYFKVNRDIGLIVVLWCENGLHIDIKYKSFWNNNGKSEKVINNEC